MQDEWHRQGRLEQHCLMEPLAVQRCRLQHRSQPESWELRFIWWECVGLQARETASQVTLRKLLPGGKGRSQVTYKFCNKGQVVWTSKDYCQLKEARYLKEFNTFLHIGTGKSLGLPRSLLSYASQPSWASILCFSTSRASLGSRWGVAAIWWLSDHICSPSWVSVGLAGSHWRAVITDDCDIRVYWSGGKCSISQKRPRSILLGLVPLPHGKRALETRLVWLRNRVILSDFNMNSPMRVMQAESLEVPALSRSVN